MRCFLWALTLMEPRSAARSYHGPVERWAPARYTPYWSDWKLPAWSPQAWRNLSRARWPPP